MADEAEHMGKIGKACRQSPAIRQHESRQDDQRRAEQSRQHATGAEQQPEHRRNRSFWRRVMRDGGSDDVGSQDLTPIATATTSRAAEQTTATNSAIAVTFRGGTCRPRTISFGMVLGRIWNQVRTCQSIPASKTRWTTSDASLLSIRR